jgi:hypothetical protein
MARGERGGFRPLEKRREKREEEKKAYIDGKNTERDERLKAKEAVKIYHKDLKMDPGEVHRAAYENGKVNRVRTLAAKIYGKKFGEDSPKAKEAGRVLAGLIQKEYGEVHLAQNSVLEIQGGLVTLENVVNAQGHKVDALASLDIGRLEGERDQAYLKEQEAIRQKAAEEQAKERARTTRELKESMQRRPGSLYNELLGDSATGVGSEMLGGAITTVSMRFPYFNKGAIVENMSKPQFGMEAYNVTVPVLHEQLRKDGLYKNQANFSFFISKNRKEAFQVSILTPGRKKDLAPQDFKSLAAVQKHLAESMKQFALNGVVTRQAEEESPSERRTETESVQQRESAKSRLDESVFASLARIPGVDSSLMDVSKLNSTSPTTDLVNVEAEVNTPAGVRHLHVQIGQRRLEDGTATFYLKIPKLSERWQPFFKFEDIMTYLKNNIVSGQILENDASESPDVS